MKKQEFYLALILSFIFFLSACSDAISLGGEDVDEVRISGDPTWENGIGALVEKKCATCHTVPANDLSPDSIPNDLDLRNYTSSNGIQGGGSIGVWIASGILTTSIGSVRKMPLAYATPLTSNEIASLQQWQSDGTPETSDSSTTEEQTGSSYYFSLCSSCHGSDGLGSSAPSLSNCSTCSSQSTLRSKIESSMPPFGPSLCSGTCAEKTAEYILATF